MPAASGTTPMRMIFLLGAGLIALGLWPSPAARAADEPAHTVIADLDAGIEVRDYAPMLLAEVTVAVQAFERAGEAGFDLLSTYLAGGNERRERIAMTAPVKQGGRPGNWVVAFVMPARDTPGTLPRPANDAVRLVEVPRRSVAAIRFSGRWSAIRHAEHQRILLRELDKAGWEAVGEPMAAQYDAPWVPGPLRRNEILLPVKRRD